MNTLVFITLFFSSSFGQQHLTLLDIPRAEKKTDQRYPQVVVAVVDDGFLVSHRDISNHLYTNPEEIPNNGVDDDANGFIDDYQGWDVSDSDNDPSVQGSLARDFYHGTYVSSLILQVAKSYFPKGQCPVKILPIKALSDRATKTYLKDGYKGIEYALSQKCDIICLAWNGGNPTPEELDLLNKAKQKGVTIVGSAGNFNDQHLDFPAKSKSVMTIAGCTDGLNKEAHSNYGYGVDLAAPGENILGANTTSDTSHSKRTGTSASCALVAGLGAILKAEDPTADILQTLVATATPITKESTYYGKLGAGFPEIRRALAYLNSNTSAGFHRASKPVNFVSVESTSQLLKEIHFDPKGSYTGANLIWSIDEKVKAKKAQIEVRIEDTVWKAGKLIDLPKNLNMPSATFTIRTKDLKLGKKQTLDYHYRAYPLDSTSLFCRGTVSTESDSGSISDGSNSEFYANNCSCKWLITAPPGKRIWIEFDSLDTQANTDILHVFDGSKTIPDFAIGQFSGSTLPPSFLSRTNQALLWFVSDPRTTRKGWSLHYVFVD